MTRVSGVYSTHELHGLGFTTADIRRAAKHGDLVDCGQGWWRTVGADPEVVSVVEAGGVLACLSAIQFHKEANYPQLWLPTRPQQSHGRLSRYGKSVAPTRRWCQGHGPPLPLARAVDDLAVALGCACRCLSEEHWIALCDSVLHYTPLTIDDIRAGMGRVTVGVERTLAKCDSRAQSGPESLTRIRLRALGFEVVSQPSIGGYEHADLRVGSLLIECDSRQFHTSADAKRNDCRRDRMTLKKGMMTMRIMCEEITNDWESVLADIRAITDRDRHRRPYRP